MIETHKAEGAYKVSDRMAKKVRLTASEYVVDGFRLAMDYGITNALDLHREEAQYVDMLVGERLLKNHLRDRIPEITRSIDTLDTYSINFGRKSKVSRYLLQPIIKIKEKPKIIYEQAWETYRQDLESWKEHVQKSSGEKRIAVIKSAIHNIMARISDIEHKKDIRTLTEILEQTEVDIRTIEQKVAEKASLRKLYYYWKEQLDNEPAQQKLT